MNELLCGCILGQFLCPVAEALWAESNAAYNVWQTTSKRDMEASYQAWLKYTNARNRYDEHVKGEL